MVGRRKLTDRWRVEWDGVGWGRNLCAFVSFVFDTSSPFFVILASSIIFRKKILPGSIVSQFDQICVVFFLPSLKIIQLLRILKWTKWSAEVFGFNQNAAMTKDMGETYTMMNDLLATIGQGGGGGGASQDEIVGEVANDVTTRVRNVFDVASVQERYPIKYEESMNTVLGQELTRYNKLLAIVHSSLSDIKKAIKGLLLMDHTLEAAYMAIFDGKVPRAGYL